jgi:exodeoxyribonuclease VIII
LTPYAVGSRIVKRKHKTGGKMKIIDYHPDLNVEEEAPCAVRGMPNEVYHASPGLSNSGVTNFLRSPGHYAFAEPQRPTRYMVIGTAIHAALLEPERFASDYVLLREVADRRASEYKQAIKTHSEEQVLVSHEATNVEGMQASVYAQPAPREALERPGEVELSLFARCPDTGVLLKCRFDKLTLDDDGARGLDLKKTQDARPDAFGRSAYNYGYYRQDPFYRTVFSLVAGYDLDSFEILAFEEKMPHGCKLYELSEADRILGYEEVGRALKDYAECVESNHWPIYDSADKETLELPNWVHSQRENEVAEEIY